MRRYITIFVLLIINFLLQTTVFRYIEIAHMVPNLILVVTVGCCRIIIWTKVRYIRRSDQRIAY